MINNNQKKYLRKLAHHLSAVIWIGQKGLTENVSKEIESALDHHELIKLKLRVGDRQARDQLIDQICIDSHAILIQKTGNVASIFRKNTESPQITLPK